MDKSPQIAELKPPQRTLMGPGPSDVDPRVLRAMAAPLVGHLDPAFLEIMNEAMELLRYVFETKNQLTIPMSGTGSAGMETCFVNLIEPGDRVVVCVNGLFGERMADVAARCGAEVARVEAPWGRTIDPADARKALRGGRPTKILAVVLAETSTGVWQPLAELERAAHEAGALFLVDAVTALGGIPVAIDASRIDACYAGTQKCLSCPPGLAPVTFNEEARKVVRGRKGKVQSWYLDLNMIENYWGKERFYHHTAPVTMVYALRESLRLIAEEGLTARFERHAQNGAALHAGLEAMGLKLHAEAGHRLPVLTSVAVPDGVDDIAVRRALLNDFGIEIGGGLGPLKGRIWRVGLMGHTSRRQNVALFLTALEGILGRLGFGVRPGAAWQAATRVYGG